MLSQDCTYRPQPCVTSFMCEFSDLRNLHAFFPALLSKFGFPHRALTPKFDFFLSNSLPCRAMALDVVEREFGRNARDAFRKAKPAPVLQFKVGIFGYMYLES